MNSLNRKKTPKGAYRKTTAPPLAGIFLIQRWDLSLRILHLIISGELLVFLGLAKDPMKAAATGG